MLAKGTKETSLSAESDTSSAKQDDAALRPIRGVIIIGGAPELFVDVGILLFDIRRIVWNCYFSRL